MAAVAALALPQVLTLLVQGAAPLLLREAPLLLLALHPYEPWSVLVAARTDVLPFTAVILAVRTVPACGGYLVGRWYGPRALDRLSRSRCVVRRLGRTPRLLSGRVPCALLVVYPGATASVLAGIARLRPPAFLPLMLTRLLVGAAVSRMLAMVAGGPVARVAALVDQHALLLGAVLLALAALAAARRRSGAQR